MDCTMTYITYSVKSKDESQEIILDSQRLAKKSPQDPYEARMIHIHYRYVK